MKKRSFFEKLTGSVSIDDEDFEIEEEVTVKGNGKLPPLNNSGSSWLEEESGEGQLAVDVYQTEKEVVVKTMVAGVKKEDLEISLSRDMITIKGRRDEEKGVPEEDYFHRELYWGSFSRSIMLPHEVEIEEAEAIEDQGLLTVRLPKVDKEKQTKLKVKTL